MRTTITLDDDIYKAARNLSRKSGKRIGEILSTLARRGLAMPRFPTFAVPPDAPIIRASRIQHALDDTIA
jgi:hypothetical protein